MKNYSDELLEQRRNILNSQGLRTYFSNIYEMVAEEIGQSEKILEVGSGAGISNIFLKQSVFRTDFFAFPHFNVMGGYVMESLPFNAETFDIVLAIDCIHHSKSPINSINELLRVVRKSGKVILVEPYVSYLSYLPYKLLHHESTTWYYKPKIKFDASPEYTDFASGDQGVSKFLLRKFKKELVTNFSVVKIKYLSPISFFATGGTTRLIPTPAGLIRFLIKLESFIPQIIMKRISSRVLISIKK